MDQLRTALVWLKRHHFWVLCGLVVIIAFASWAKASGKLTELFTKNQSAIKAQFGEVQGLRKDPFHPNEDVNTKQEAQTAQQAKDVAKLWQQLYDRQRKHVLEWPANLSKDFRDNVEKLQFGADIRGDLRNHYQNYIENHFPELPKQINARAIDASVTAGSGPGGGAEFRGPEGAGSPGELADDSNYYCLWNPADQALVREELNFREQPRALRIWVTQEDLWVYHTMLDVIAKTNEAAKTTRMANAAVQEVGELSVGARAGKGSRTPNRLMVRPSAPAAAAGVGPEGGPGMAGPGMAGPGGPPGPGGAEGPGMRSEFQAGGPNSGAMTEEQEKGFLLSGRYLNAQGTPIPFGAGGAAAATPGAEAPPTPPPTETPGAALDLTVFGQEYKRLPVRMALKMDQRWLPRLIAECASEPLQIEVQEVRINPPEGIGSTNGAGPGSTFRPGEGAGGSASIFPDEPGMQPFPNQPEIVNVIIQGTIFIFNKPNPAVLGEPPAAAAPPATAAAVAQ